MKTKRIPRPRESGPAGIALLLALVAATAACEENNTTLQPQDAVPGDTGNDGDLPAAGVDTDGDGLDDRDEIIGWEITLDLSGRGAADSERRRVDSDPQRRDTDGDGLDDREEYAIRSDPGSTDTDGDGLDDREEWVVWRTKPTCVDTDGDAWDPNGPRLPVPQLFDGAEVNLLRTSPLLADSDGDSRSDLEEFVDPGFSPLLAELPEVAVEPFGEVAIALNVEYEESLGETSSYTESFEQTHGRSFTRDYSQKLKVGQEISGSSNPIIGADVKTTWELEVAFSQSLTDTSERKNSYQQFSEDSLQNTESFSSGLISMGVQITNPSPVAYTIDGLGLTVLKQDFALDRGETLKVVGTLRPQIDEPLVLAPGETSEPIQVESSDVNPDLIKQFLARPSSLIVRPTNVRLQDENGIDVDFIRQVTNGRTASLEIDFGGERIERHVVAAATGAPVSGGLGGVRLVDVLEHALELPRGNAVGGFTIGTRPAGTFLESLEGRSFETATDPGGQTRTSAAWSVSVESDDPFVLAQDFEDFESLRIQPGDRVLFFYCRDGDLDGIGDCAEVFYGASDDGVDSDGDGVTDRREIAEGWQLASGETVFSHPGLKDTDADGLSDLAEYGLDPEGNPLGVWEQGTGFAYDDQGNIASFRDPVTGEVLHLDPTHPDTDRDGFFDGDDRRPLQPAIVYYVDAAGAGDGTSWDAASPDLQRAVDQWRARALGDDFGVPDIAEIWVASGEYSNLRTVDSRFTGQELRLFGGFQGTETKRGQRLASAAGNATVLRASGSSNHISVDGAFQFDGFTVDNGVQSVRAIGFSADAPSSVRNVLFVGNTRQSNAESDAPVNVNGRVDILFEDCVFAGNQNLSQTAYDHLQQSPTTALAATALERNTALSPSGGAVACTMNGTATALFRRCSFAGNFSGKYGGALSVRRGQTQLSACDFTGNEALSEGGAVFVHAGASCIISHCTFQGNLASARGGALAMDRSSVDVIGSQFYANHVHPHLYEDRGFAHASLDQFHKFQPRDPIDVAVGYDQPTVRRGFGGAILNRSGMLRIVNSALIKNSVATNTSNDPAGVYPDTIGAALAHMNQNRPVGAVSAGSTVLEQSIVRGNVINWAGDDATEIRGEIRFQVAEVFSEGHDGNRNWYGTNFRGPELRLVRCSVPETYPGVAFTQPVLGEPRFLALAEYERVLGQQPRVYARDQSASDDIRLHDDSPLVDAGFDFVDLSGVLPGTQLLGAEPDAWHPGPIDLDGRPRFFGGRVDVGPYENQGDAGDAPVEEPDPGP